jgi:hypothetical protein
LGLLEYVEHVDLLLLIVDLPDFEDVLVTDGHEGLGLRQILDESD